MMTSPSECKLKDPLVLRVFFSSPFSGMEEERELLTKRYWPQLQSFCQSKGVQFRPVDMRWGITSEATDDAQTVSICLRELDRSDLFVGFYGQRYGWHGKEDKFLQKNFNNAAGRYPWIENHRDKSITELEFLHGHLNQPGDMPACFAFRDKKYDDLCREAGMKEGDKKKVSKYSAESDSAAAGLADLKQRVAATKDKALGVESAYKSPEEGVKFIFECLWKYLTEVLLSDDLSGSKPSVREMTGMSHEAFKASRQGLYVGGDHYFELLDRYTSGDDDDSVHKPLLVLGESGCGKSAMLCNWINSRQATTSDHLFYHFVGCDSDSTRKKPLLQRIVREMKYIIEPSVEDKNLMSGSRNEQIQDMENTNINKNTNPASSEEQDTQSAESMGKIINMDNIPALDGRLKDSTVDTTPSSDDEKKDTDPNSKEEKIDTTPNSNKEKSKNDFNTSISTNEIDKDAEKLTSGNSKTEEIISTKEDDKEGNKITINDAEVTAKGSDKDENKDVANKQTSHPGTAKTEASKPASRPGTAGLKRKDPEDSEKELLSKNSRELSVYILDLLKNLGKKQQRAVFVIDGLNMIDAISAVEKPLFWLPKTLPSNTFFIVTTSPSDTKTVEELKENRKCQTLDVTPLSKETKKELCLALFKENSKSLSPHQLNIIIQSPETENPLFLSILIEELCMFGQFRKLTEKIEELLACRGIPELFRKFLERLESDYNTKDHPDIVKQILCALSVCHQGLTETQILAVFDIKSIVWSPLYFSLEKYLLNRSGCLALAFDVLKAAVMERYMANPNTKAEYVKQLAAHFENDLESTMNGNTSEMKNKIEEALYLLDQAGESIRLSQILTKLPVFQHMINFSRYNLLKYWHTTGISPTQIARRYIKEVDKFLTMEYDQFKQGRRDDIPITKVVDILEDLNYFMDMAKFFQGNIYVLERHLALLENISTGSLKDELQIIDAKYDLACCYVDQSIPDVAERYHQEVLDFRKKHVADGTVEEEQLGFSYHGLGLLYSSLKEYDKAEPMWKNSFEIHKKMNGKNSKIHLAATITAQGTLACRRGDAQKALEMYQEALKLEEEFFSSEFHPRLAGTTHNIGWAHRMIGNLDEAEAYYLKALSMSMNALGPKHPDTGMRYMNLGTLEMKRKNWAKAEMYHRNCLEVYKFAMDSNHSSLMMAKENIVLVSAIQLKMEEVEEMYHETLEFRLKNKTFDHSLPGAHRRFAKHYMINRQFETASRILMVIIDSKFAKPKTYVDLKNCDMNLPAEKRPVRELRYTLDGAMDRFPDNPEYIAAKIRFELLPNKDIDKMKELCHNYIKLNKPSEDVKFPGSEVFNEVIVTGLEVSSHLDSDVTIVPDISEDRLQEIQLAILEEGLKLYPEHTEYMDCKSVVLESLNRVDEALTWLKKSCEELPDSTSEVKDIVTRALKFKDKEFAQEVIYKAEKKWPDKEEWVQELRKLLAEEEVLS